MKETMFDVVAVDMKKHTVRFMAENKNRRNADAIESMAVMRRGVEDEFFAVVPHGKYDAGDKWAGID